MTVVHLIYIEPSPLRQSQAPSMFSGTTRDSLFHITLQLLDSLDKHTRSLPADYCTFHNSPSDNKKQVRAVTLSDQKIEGASAIDDVKRPFRQGGSQKQSTNRYFTGQVSNGHDDGVDQAFPNDATREHFDD